MRRHQGKFIWLCLLLWWAVSRVNSLLSITMIYLIYIAQFDTNGILTALYIVIKYYKHNMFAYGHAFRSLCTVLLHFCSGRPLFLFPLSVRYSVVLGRERAGIRLTCPRYHQRRACIDSSMAARASPFFFFFFFFAGCHWTLSLAKRFGGYASSTCLGRL